MDSLNSEGITFRKPARSQLVVQQTRSSKKRKNEDDDDDSDYEPELETSASVKLRNDYLKTYEAPDAETIRERQKLYEECKKDLQDIYDSVQRRFNLELEKGFEKFMDSSLQLVSDNSDGCLPIGIVESGLSTKENSALFDVLEEKLKLQTARKGSKERILVTRINSSSNSSTKTIFQKMCAQLVNSILSQNESAKDYDFLSSKLDKKNAHYSMYDVKRCLQQDEGTRFNIVILIEDVEYFAISIISQLLVLMGCANLPVIFVFGTTHGHFVNNLVPAHSPSQYVIEKIYSVSAKEHLQEFMRRIIFNIGSPFRVSGEIISFLESLYKEENFSIQHISNSLAICIRYHFLTAKSAFCSWKKSAMYSKADKDRLLNLIEAEKAEKSPRKRIKINISDFNADEYIDTSLESLENWLFMFRIMCFINLRLAGEPLGETYCQVYASCCKGIRDWKALNADDPFEKFFRALKDASKTAFGDILEDCLNFLKGTKTLPEVSLKNQMATGFQDILNEMEEKENQEQVDGDISPTSQRNKRLRIPKTNDLKKVQNMVLKSRSETMSPFLKGKTKFVELLGELLKNHLPPLSELQFSKAFIFADLSLLVNTISPANFLKLDEDLRCPGLSLQCECCSSLDAHSVDVDLPDVSILHKLISEHTTKKVDLNLVYRAFLGVVDQKKQRKSKVDKDAVQASYLKRFRRGVGELQHMGFLKRSKTKPDEVTRLTWW